MSRRPPAVIAVLGATALLALTVLAGCAAGTPSSSPTRSAGSSATAAPHTPTPAPTPTFVAKPYTCDSILPPATLAVFQSKASAGFTLQKDYVERVRNFSPDLSQFADWGGILCQWAYPDASQSVDYGFSAITMAQMTAEEASLSSNGYTGSPKDHGTVYVNSDLKDFPDTYLFINGYWFYGSSDAVLGLIVDNVFQTPAN